MKRVPRKCQPTWVQIDRSPHLLHRLAQGAVENYKWVVRSYRGVVMCGLKSTEFWYPGVGSRLGAARCKHCCKAVGIPAGEGTSINAKLKEKKHLRR